MQINGLCYASTFLTYVLSRNLMNLIAFNKKGRLGAHP